MTTLTLPPGPRGSFLWGSLPEFRRDMLGFFRRHAREYGDAVSFRFANRRVMLLSHPDLIEEVLVERHRQFTKHYALQLLRPTVGNGLLTSEGEFWLRQRRLIQPAFARERIDAYGPIMVEHTRRLIEDWRPGERRDLHDDMVRLTLGIVAKTLMDVDLSEDFNHVSAAQDVVLADFRNRFKTIPLPFWLPTPGNLRLKQAVARLDAVIHRIIEQRRAAGEDHGDFLSALLRARDAEDGRGMSDRQVRDEVMTMLLAGHETTANALSWLWYLLGRHPRVEEKLLAELREKLGDREARPEDVPRLPYTACVIHETMRLFPPAYAFGRRAVCDTEIGPYAVPAGTNVLMSQWVMHRDERWFENPEEFLPERWENGLAKTVSKYVYFPFGAGPRVCIGQQFAHMELVLILATFLRRIAFRLEAEEIRPWPSVTLRPAGGVHALVEPRGGFPGLTGRAQPPMIQPEAIPSPEGLP